MLSQRVVENFFKRARFRRSKRLRSSVRSSLAKKGSRMAATASEEGKEGKCDGGSQVADPGGQLPSMSTGAFDTREQSPQQSSSNSPTEQTMATASTNSNGVANSSSAADIISTSATESRDCLKNAEQNCNSANATQASGRASSQLPSGQSSLLQSAGSSVSTQNLPSQVSSVQQTLPHQALSGEASLSEPSLQTTADLKVVETLRGEVDRLKKELLQSQEMVHKMQDREKQLRNRLSEQAQRQLQKGASKFEDLNLGESRPTQLIKRYGNLYSESRLDAMDALDDVPNMADSEDLKVKLLLSVIVLAFRSTEKTLKDTRAKMRELLHIPRVMTGGNSAFCHAAKDLEESIAFYLRKTVDRHDVSKNYKEVCERVWSTLFDYPMLKECQGLLRYIDDCVQLAWAMTVQNPPFVIDYESRAFDPDLHVRFHTSDADSLLITSVLWPVLLEGDGGPCVSKGVVLT